MKEKSSMTDSERLARLEKENEELRRRLEAKAPKDDDVQSYRIFIEARKKFLAWVGVVIFIISAFGFVSVSSIVSSLKDKIEERGVEGIVAEIKEDFEKKYQGIIVDETISRLLPTIEGRVEQVVREELLSGVKRAQKGVTDPDQVDFAEAIEESYRDERYFVVAGTSPRHRDLVEELNRVRDQLGEEFDRLFPGVRICPPSKGNRHYAIVIGFDMPFNDAQGLREQAVRMGFREDTFLGKTSRAFFECEKKE